ncbi:MAG: J domain-containing protein [Clostridia bacterium]|nr:J domain-containing protein [Clostridia bacterium]
MNKKNLEILGLEEGATLEEVKTAYDNLRAKYLEDRFKDGETGNEAARMLTKIEVAYTELENELKESTSADGGDLYEKVEELLKDGNISEAQRVLDNFNERGGRWHYLQSVVFYRKNWINESKKQLEIAIQLEPENQKYKETYRKLNEKISSDAQASGQASSGQTNGAYQGQTMDSGASDNQMGGNFCANCIECCYLNMCLNCLCNGCCR